MKSEADRYVEQLLELYLSLPETPARTSRADRRLAYQLQQQQMPLAMIEAAFLLASARRLFRDSALAPLGPIRSLHYFLPVIEEISANGLAPEYVQYLRSKLVSLSAQTRD
jgi:hypothetical protein